MNKIIYDIRENKYLQHIIEEQKKYFNELNYKDELGQYGTREWWDNLDKKGLIMTVEGEITKFFPAGKTSIPLFELTTDERKNFYAAPGDKSSHKVGNKVILYTIKNDEVFKKK